MADSPGGEERDDFGKATAAISGTDGDGESFTLAYGPFDGFEQGKSWDGYYQTGTASDGFFGAVDDDGDGTPEYESTLQISSVVDVSTNATLTVTDDGKSITFAPTHRAHSRTQFRYTVIDGAGDSDTAEVILGLQALSFEQHTTQLNWTAPFNLLTLNGPYIPTGIDPTTVEVEFVQNPTKGKLVDLFESEPNDSGRVFRWVQLAQHWNWTGTETVKYKLSSGDWTGGVGEIQIHVGPNIDLAQTYSFRVGVNPPPHSETDPGAIGDINQVENPHAGYGSQNPTILQISIHDQVSDLVQQYKGANNNQGFWTQLAAYVEGNTLGVLPNLGPEAFDLMEKYLGPKFWDPNDDQPEPPYDLIVRKFLAEDAVARSFYEQEFETAVRELNELEFIGSLSFVNSFSHLGSAAGRTASPWGFAVGEYTGWGSFRVTGSIEQLDMNYDVHFKYNIWDPYDWAPNKGGIPGKLARFFGEMHLRGLAKQFIMEGDWEARSDWAQSDDLPVPPQP